MTDRDRAADAVARRTVVQPSFTPEAAAVVRRHIQLAGDGALECSFSAQWDPQTEMITGVELLTRGSGATTFTLDPDFRPGSIDLHNHTWPASVLAPSAEDLASAIALAKRGIGSAICDNNAERLVVIRAPRPIVPRPSRVRCGWPFRRLIGPRLFVAWYPAGDGR